jgi:arginine N-succinyltransferase
MYLLRDARQDDLSGLGRLARILNTVNLPDDRTALREVLDRSIRSFAGKVKDPKDALYLFVLEDLKSHHLSGTSLIIAKHGTRDAPHVYFDVSEREHYSATLDRHFRHQVLSIGYNYDGPTEIGGLIVDPAFRGHDRPGKQLSYIRFLFIAMQRPRFRDRVLAELLPPLGKDGKSVLWEALGRKFTDLDYQEADKYSRKNKEFIQQLFPGTDIYTTLFPKKVQRVIGQVGPKTEPVKNMLERIGFRYVQRIDPFDGGPHFECPTADISVIKKCRKVRVANQPLDQPSEEMLVAYEPRRGGNRIRAVKTPCRIESDIARLPKVALRVLGASEGETVQVIPFQG